MERMCSTFRIGKLMQSPGRRARRHAGNDRFQHFSSLAPEPVILRADAHKSVRPVTVMAGGQIALKRIAALGNGDVEGPQGAAAVEAEQAADILRAMLHGRML